MLHASICIDLPSEPYPTSGRVASLLRWIVLGPDPHAGRKHITVNGLTVFEKLLAGFEAGGFDDMVSVSVGGDPVYVDTEQRMDDVKLALERTLERGALRSGVRDVRLVFSQTHDGVHSLADVTLDEDVLIEEHEVVIRWSTRLSTLRVQPGEGPLDYRERIRAAVSRDGLRSLRAATEAAGQRLVEQLRAHLEPATVSSSGTVARVVVPGPTQVGRFRHLGFGRQLRPRAYRAVPREKRTGAYDDPHVYYYYDPYHDLLSWILTQEVLAGRWDGAGVEFVHRDGHPLNLEDPQARSALEVPSDAVQFGAKALTIADDLPSVGFDPAESGSPHTPGWGGENA